MWRVRYTTYIKEAKEIAVAMRKEQKERKTLGPIRVRSGVELVITRTVPLAHCTDALTAQIFVGDLIYRSWPQGFQKPHNGRISAEFKAEANDV